MGLYLLIPTFVVILVSILIVRAGGIALRMTGLDEKTANFQALSAFTRAGFTTKESEVVVGHPQRRSIITWLIVLGNAGIVAVIVTATASLTTSTNYRLAIDIGILIIGLYVIYRLAKHTGILRRWEGLVENRLMRGSLFVGVEFVEHILHLADGYGVARVSITEKSSLAGRSFEGGGLAEGKLSVLGIEREGKWITAPGPDESITAGDVLVLYGRLTRIDQFFGIKRRARKKTAKNIKKEESASPK